MALMPSSNFSPKPNLLPIARSKPPSTIQIIKIHMMTSLIPTEFPSSLSRVRPQTLNAPPRAFVVSLTIVIDLAHDLLPSAEESSAKANLNASEPH